MLIFSHLPNARYFALLKEDIIKSARVGCYNPKHKKLKGWQKQNKKK